MTTRRCRACGAELAKSAIRCSTCGTRLTEGDKPSGSSLQSTAQFSRLQVAGLALTLVALVILRLFMTEPTTGRHRHTYNVALSGNINTHEIVGTPTALKITVSNNGKRIPHLVLVVAGMTSWQVLGTDSCNGPGKRLRATVRNHSKTPYDFGQIGTGEQCHVSFNLVPRRVGRPALGINTYANVRRDGTVKTPIQDADASLQWQLSITQ